MCRRLLFLTLSLLSLSCTVVIPESDIPGVWQSSDGAKIEFKDDHTCVVTNINGTSLFWADDTEKMTFSGTWKYSKEFGTSGQNVVWIDPDLNPDQYHPFRLYFSGEGILENSKPFSLYFYISVDSLERYEFYKLE